MRDNVNINDDGFNDANDDDNGGDVDDFNTFSTSFLETSFHQKNERNQRTRLNF